MNKDSRPDKVEVYFNRALQRTILIHTNCDENCSEELGKYIDQFENKPGYEVYINGQLYEIGDVPLPE